MIVWCAYCQHFLYESKPLDDYRISHGICHACMPKMATFSDADKKGLEGVIAFFQHLEKSALSGTSIEFAQVLAESDRLRIQPLDLMMGFLQPLLAEIGDLWAANKVSVGTEHQFSALAQELVTHFHTKAKSVDWTAPPELLLVNAEGNDHTLGLQMAEAQLTAYGIPTLVATPGLPTRECLDLLDYHRPRAVGFSVALPDQMEKVLEAIERLEELPKPPQRILLGGPAVRMGLDLDPQLGIDVCRDLSEVPRLLGLSKSVP